MYLEGDEDKDSIKRVCICCRFHAQLLKSLPFFFAAFQDMMRRASLAEWSPCTLCDLGRGASNQSQSGNPRPLLRVKIKIEPISGRNEDPTNQKFEQSPDTAPWIEPIKSWDAPRTLLRELNQSKIIGLDIISEIENKPIKRADTPDLAP